MVGGISIQENQEIISLMTKSFSVLPLGWTFSYWFRRSKNNSKHFYRGFPNLKWTKP